MAFQHNDTPLFYRKIISTYELYSLLAPMTRTCVYEVFYSSNITSGAIPYPITLKLEKSSKVIKYFSHKYLVSFI